MEDDDAENDDEEELASMSTEQLRITTRTLGNGIRVLTDELQRISWELGTLEKKTEKNKKKIDIRTKLPYIVATVAEIYSEDEAQEDGANVDQDLQRKGKCVILNFSTRLKIFVPVIRFVDPDKLKPGDLVAVHKYNWLILDTLPSIYDSQVKVLQGDEKPTEGYNDIGGLDQQIQELAEAIVLPLTHKDRFQKLGIRPPKGVLLYGPPGTGKTLMARACAAQTDANFLKLTGPQLNQTCLGKGAKLLRDAFLLAKEKAPCIIFIDELDPIGSKHFVDRKVQHTIFELLKQLDGFSSDDRIKMIECFLFYKQYKNFCSQPSVNRTEIELIDTNYLAATNRADILDPALLRSGRIERKIEFPHPSEKARIQILHIHSRTMNVHPNVNFEELACLTDGFNGAQLKAVCVEAGMLALRRDATDLTHNDFVEGIIQIQMKKKAGLDYYA